ncbi:MAG: protein translocase subunit SecD [Pseudomonadota bacterium]|nr:protein translocase subunit SecD [Pseudomonadota bacterium]
MEGGLIARIVACVAAVLIAVWLLLPTFLGPEVQKNLELNAERAAMEDPPPLETPLPEYVNWLPNLKVNLGLDLQGGIDLTLTVETDEAVLATVQRDVVPVKVSAEKEGVKLADVKRDRRRAALLILPGEGATLDTIQSFLRKRFSAYAYEHTEAIEGKDWLVFAVTDQAKADIARNAVDQALETIRNRIDETGVKEPSITRKGERDIAIQLPGETDVEQAVAAVGTTARLEFMLVDEEADATLLDTGLAAAQAAMPPADFADDRVLSDWLADNQYLVEGRRLLWEHVTEKGVDSRAAPHVLKEEVVLSGDDVNDAQTSANQQTGEYYVALEFKPRGQAIFADVTGKNVGKRFAIVLDDEVRSAPVINERIDGVASIAMGGMNIDEQIKDAGMLALVLRSGALPAPVSVGEVRTVGASLGAQAIEEGLLAAVLGSALVLLFAAVYYKVSGLLADLTLVINGVLLVALLALAGATLTLPGICGIALTIGMAVDCNIIIFERIREELRAGRSIRAAIDAGFDRATVAVVDSNVTTLLAGVVLYSYGTGPIKGFAVTLMIGIFTTLFTGVFVSRTLMDLVNRGQRARMSI